MVHGGPVGIVLLVILAAFLAGPVIRAVVAAGESVGRAVRSRVAGAAIPGPADWRIEAATMLDSQAVFEDLPDRGAQRDRRTGRSSRASGRSEPSSIKANGPTPTTWCAGASSRSWKRTRARARPGCCAGLGPGDPSGRWAWPPGAARNATVRTTVVGRTVRHRQGSLRAVSGRLPRAAGNLTRPWDTSTSWPPCLPFAHLGTEDLARLAREGQWVNLAPGATLMEQGEPGTTFYALATGQVEIVQDGRRVASAAPASMWVSSPSSSMPPGTPRCGR